MIATFIGVIIRIFSNSFANTFQKDLVKTNSSAFVTFLTYLFLSLFCLYPALKTDWTSFSVGFWFYVIIANILCTLSSICLIKALRTGELSVLSSINSYKCIVGLIGAIIILKEIPNIWGFIGMALIIFGSWFVFETTKEGFSIEFLKREDVILRILAMLLAGSEAVILKKIIIMSSFDISYILWCFGGLIFTVPILILYKNKISCKFEIKNIHKFFILAVCVGLMQYSTNFVFSRLDVGLSLALFQLSTIVNLFIGYKIFRESDIIKKLIGIIIMLLGSFLILVLNH